MQNQEKITLLIVDDEIVSRSSLEALLESDEYQLFFAENGAQGLEKAESIHPALVILDVMMPGMNGFEVCRRLRANPTLAQTPIMMITAWDDPTAKQRCLDVGANDVICKPFNRADLHARVQKLIITA
ncbi:response regulator [Beggiatoa leptomitoformis]|nr:response regulator [Beggiatoa leptomitoformis]